MFFLYFAGVRDALSGKEQEDVRLKEIIDFALTTAESSENDVNVSVFTTGDNMSNRENNNNVNIRVSDIVSFLGAKYPQLVPILGVSMIAINMEYFDKDMAVVLDESDEIAIIPPVSGG